ncbi:MAG: hypothetical protein GX661_05000 [Acholeplasmataceae bacterium]|nr:hypothetical protein [Acholeplasmataceae bacterium]
MNCREKRSFFNIFTIFDCRSCPFQKEDENLIIGENNIGIYHLFRDCPQVPINKDDLYYDHPKLRHLLMDAIRYQEEIFLLFVEEFRLSSYIEVFDKILDSGLSIQIITD